MRIVDDADGRRCDDDADEDSSRSLRAVEVVQPLVRAVLATLRPPSDETIDAELDLTRSRSCRFERVDEAYERIERVSESA